MKTTFLTIGMTVIFNALLFGQSSQDKAPEAFQKQLTMVYETYINLKDAFVSSDAKQVKERAQQMKTQLNKVDMELLEGDAHINWMKQLKAFNQNLKTMESSEDLSAQREAFAGLSDAMYESVKAFGITGMNAYYQYCPMALNNAGAYWLNTSKEIRNPYFGDRMLKCGKTKEVVNE